MLRAFENEAKFSNKDADWHLASASIYRQVINKVLHSFCSLDMR
jgi:hypothetical protein